MPPRSKTFHSWISSILAKSAKPKLVKTFQCCIHVESLADLPPFLSIRSTRFVHQSALCRSSQPLAGFSSKCIEDQLLLEAVRLANPSCSVLYVVDTRPALNALTNRAQGKGYEDTTVYRNIAIQFFDIENIHVVRGSLEKLLKVCQEPALPLEQYHQGLEKSGWFRHLRVILEAAFFVANRLNEGNSVLVHCSDGWDRTAQVCSLAQIVLDPYYRTFVGFEALIKKEWIYFGHKFSERLGLTSGSDPREISPIFCQFLNCVHHLIELCPTKFEYNSSLLSLLHDEAYSAVYGTFVGCSEKERRQLKIPENAYSVWPLVELHRNEFSNPYYEHADHLAHGLDFSLGADNPYDGILNGIELTTTTGGNCRHAVDMLPSFVLAPQLFRLWHELFLRWEWRLPRPELRHMEIVSDVVTGQNTLASHRRLLEARIGQLSKLLNKPLDSVLSHGDQTPPRVKPAVENGDSSKVISVANLGAHLDLPDVFTSSIHSPQFRRNKVDATDSSADQRNNDTSTLKHRKAILEDANRLSLVTAKQLSLELNSISAHWVHISRKDVLCSICGTLLVLSTNSSHCHCCGKTVCSRCVSHKPVNLLGLWEFRRNSVCVCERCATRFRVTAPKHFSQIQQSKNHSTICTEHCYDPVRGSPHPNTCRITQ
ncbi:Myotubularin protein 6 [Fasciolopsis buskii]|uniref:Myotubularin protein 6 n=1 Tax=Fasciolopsis buskii TaxID=27845 RepID=A0A8E0RTH9_9TREM|nr:Myotubularin protein 6 [Fasciolopsis buski]